LDFLGHFGSYFLAGKITLFLNIWRNIKRLVLDKIFWFGKKGMASKVVLLGR